MRILLFLLMFVPILGTASPPTDFEIPTYDVEHIHDANLDQNQDVVLSDYGFFVESFDDFTTCFIFQNVPHTELSVYFLESQYREELYRNSCNSAYDNEQTNQFDTSPNIIESFRVVHIDPGRIA